MLSDDAPQFARAVLAVTRLIVTAPGYVGAESSAVVSVPDRGVLRLPA